MRYLLILLLSPPAFAGNWMSPTDMAAVRGDAPGYQVYSNQVRCESTESEPCYNITGKDPKTHSIQQVREGSWEAASNVEDCLDDADCQAKIADPVAKCGDASYQAFYGDLDGDSPLDAQGNSSMTDLEAWCTRRELVNRLKPDAALQAAWDAAQAQKAADEGTKAAKKSQRLTDKDACVAAVNGAPALTPAQIKDCLNVLIKEVYEESIPPSDL